MPALPTLGQRPWRPQFVDWIEDTIDPTTGLMVATALTGARAIPLHDKGGRGFSVDAYGAVGDGVTDDSAAVQAAQDAAGGDFPVIFSPGKSYRIETAITVPDRYAWVADRGERGTNAKGMNADYPSTQIIWRPAVTTTHLVAKWSTTASLASNIGPFYHRGITFDFGDANGFKFGEEDLNGDGSPDSIGNGTGQRYVFGARFEDCAFTSTPATRTSDGNGVITRSGRIQVHMTKCFESGIFNCSQNGSDIGYRFYGCDKPVVRGGRSNSAHLPIDIQGAVNAAFAVQYTVEDFQAEGWTFGAIAVRDAEATITDCRLEQNDGSPTGAGRYAIGSCTFAVTAGSGTLTASRSMDGVLFAGLSLLEITDGTNTDKVLVTAVSGTSVTVDTTAFTFTWSAAAATAHRIHGYGVLSNSKFTVNIQGTSPHASPGCPSVVYVVNRGSTHVTGSGVALGTGGPWPGIAVGNRLLGTNYMQSQLIFEGCSSEIVGDPSNPFIVVSNVGALHGAAAWNASQRIYPPHMDEVRALTRRIWVWNPKGGTTLNNNMHLKVFKRVAVDADTTQFVWAQRLSASANQFYDTNLPSIAGRTYQMRINIRGESSSGTCSVTAVGAGANVSLGTGLAFTTTWSTITRTFQTPACWTAAAGRTSATATFFQIVPSVEALLAVVEIEEVSADPLAVHSLQIPERAAAPSAPANDDVIIYAVDNGAGKTQLMALFSTGAAQQLAIEP